MTTVETRVINPVGSSAPVEPVDVAEAVDAALQHEEETMMAVDEEVTSCDDEELENHMVQVALAKSVEESGNIAGSQGSRYGLRKRRRPGDSPTNESPEDTSPKDTDSSGQVKGEVKSRIETSIKLEKPKADTHAKPPAKPPGESTISVKPETQFCMTGAVESKGITSIPKVVTPKLVLPLIPGGMKSRAAAQPVSILQKPSAAKAQSPPAKATTKSSSKAKASPSRSKAQKQEPEGAVPTPLNHLSSPTPSFAAPGNNASKPEELLPTSGAVPNPLLHATPAPAPAPQSYTTTEGPADSSEAPVPCPLPAPVPCPLQPQPESTEKKVTILEPPVSEPPEPEDVPMRRGRIFSVDLDPSTFDFSDMGGVHCGDNDKSDDAPPDTTSELRMFQRERAFSFEFFNFAGDDLLPAAPVPAVHTSSDFPDPTMSSVQEAPPAVRTRPRGDSIIFDPVSFQEGGIHEKNALLKVNASSTAESAATPALLADSRLAAPPTAPLPHPGAPPNPSPASTPNPITPYAATSSPQPVVPGQPQPAQSGQIATLPSGLNNNGNGAAPGATSPATFQMELLNKDGRIGIYLPDARKARIARFHAKRKMRIWRKRIKYDCRKKLADSRPRIKGRFVKRVDMDDE